MSDWPRCMSPAANTPGTLVIQRSSRHTVPRSVMRTPRSSSSAPVLGPDEAHGQQHQIGRHLERRCRAPARSSMRPSATLRSTRWPCRARTRPASSPLKMAWSPPHRRDRRPPRAPTRCGRRAATSATGCRRRASRGGAGSSSSWATDRAPWRCTVPRQSAPVSPPPMMTTCLPAAEIAAPSSTASPWQRRFCCGEVVHREVHAGQLAARHRRDRAAGRRRRPAAPRRSRGAGRRPATSTPACTPGRKTTPSAASSSSRRSSTRFSILNSGMP